MSDYIDSLFSLKGKVAIVTGCSRGIGAAIARSFLLAGANVIGLARSNAPEGNDVRLVYCQCDVNDINTFKSLCINVIKRFGRLDILVNAAGITQSDPSEEGRYLAFMNTVEVNLTAAYKCSDIAFKYMSEGGSIINVTSIGSFQGFPENPGYVASKGGLRLLTKALAIDYAVRGIRVNNLAPGYVESDMTRKSFQDPVRHEERLSRMTIKRWGTVEDIAGVAVFLASNASNYMTGADIVVDGGWTSKGL